MERLAVGRGRLLPSKAPSKEKAERGPENPAGQALCRPWSVSGSKKQGLWV